MRIWKNFLPYYSLDGIIKFFERDGGIAKWTKATVCKTVTLGSNPSAAYLCTGKKAELRFYFFLQHSRSGYVKLRP